MSEQNSFNSKSTLSVAGKDYQVASFKALNAEDKLAKLPYSLKVLLENMLRLEDGVNVTKADINALLNWDSKAEPSQEISFTPARVLMQDFTGVPAVVDLAAMRDAMQKLGGDAKKINPLSPADLVIDHSVMVDHYGHNNSLDLNAELEFRRNAERYEFLRWGSTAFDDFQVVPPATGICHQVNLEFLAKAVFTKEQDGKTWAYPDSLVGTDSHTTMINGLGVLGWGVGGIEAEAAMLGQPITMLIPHVIGFRLDGKLKEGATATDLVLTVVEMLRKRGVVGKFVEFFGDGLDYLSLADKATIANMAPEYGATCGIFPIDNETLNYMRLSGREETQIELVEAYAKHQGMFREKGGNTAEYTDVLSLDLNTVVPSLAGPKRPQDRITLEALSSTVDKLINESNGSDKKKSVSVTQDGNTFDLTDGDVVIAAITSCTNTSNPDVMVAAGLVAQKAAALGMTVQPWVKTSLAPGSQVVAQYLKNAGLDKPLNQLGFDIVGFGCTTCIGNSGPLPEAISPAIIDNDLVACSVLSGNRNFEGRVHSDVQMNFLASPPLVVAYALAGSTLVDLYKDAVGKDKDGNDVFLKDIWPSQQEIRAVVDKHVTREMFQEKYSDVFKGDARWQAISSEPSAAYNWNSESTYVQNPPYFDGMTMDIPALKEIKGARVLAFLGDSITTDHISPAGAIKEDSPAGDYLKSKGVSKTDFNSYGSRRGNHEVMMRGTFANVRLKNLLAPGTEGGFTCFQPTGEQMSIFDAAMQYKENDTPLVVIAGKEYGTGSSRDWAAKGSMLLGVKAVLTESFERIHRSNLIGMGVLPLQFKAGDTKDSLGLNGKEVYSIEGLSLNTNSVTVVVNDNDGKEVKRFEATVRIDTPKEWEYYQNGGILNYVLRQLAQA